MEINVNYRGIIISKQDIEFINRLMSDNPNDSRWKISRKLCKAWNWVQPNGALKDMICRGFMLRLEEAGYIKLPPKKRDIINPFIDRKKPKEIQIDKTDIETTLSKIQPINIYSVRRTKLEKLFNSLIDRYHYLGYTHPVGEHIKYMVYSGLTPIACLAFSSAPWYIGDRDRFIGWDRETRKKNLHLIVNNTRFLIFDWIKVPHLASHILSSCRKILARDWLKIYNHPIYFIETFVDTEKFAGTCYKADNWIYLGQTTGRGKLSKSSKPTLSKKAIYGYPLNKNFREFLNY